VYGAAHCWPRSLQSQHICAHSHTLTHKLTHTHTHTTRESTHTLLTRTHTQIHTAHTPDIHTAHTLTHWHTDTHTHTHSHTLLTLSHTPHTHIHTHALSHTHTHTRKKKHTPSIRAQWRGGVVGGVVMGKLWSDAPTSPPSLCLRSPPCLYLWDRHRSLVTNRFEIQSHFEKKNLLIFFPISFSISRWILSAGSPNTKRNTSPTWRWGKSRMTESKSLNKNCRREYILNLSGVLTHHTPIFTWDDILDNFHRGPIRFLVDHLVEEAGRKRSCLLWIDYESINREVVYYESIKRELQTRPIYDLRFFLIDKKTKMRNLFMFIMNR
jgi:hypothetical protein